MIYAFVSFRRLSYPKLELEQLPFPSSQAMFFLLHVEISTFTQDLDVSLCELWSWFFCYITHLVHSLNKSHYQESSHNLIYFFFVQAALISSTLYQSIKSRPRFGTSHSYSLEVQHCTDDVNRYSFRLCCTSHSIH